MKQFADIPKRSRALVVAGGVLVASGVFALACRLGSVAWLVASWALMRGIVSVAAPVGLIAVGVYVIWAWRAGKFAGVHPGASGAPLHASASNERICGVCGGIAEYTALPPALVRLTTLLLFLAAPMVMGFVYLIFALALPRA